MYLYYIHTVAKECIFRDDDDCLYVFTHERLPNGTYYIEVKEDKGKNRNRTTVGMQAIQSNIFNYYQLVRYDTLTYLFQICMSCSTWKGVTLHMMSILSSTFILFEHFLSFQMTPYWNWWMQLNTAGNSCCFLYFLVHVFTYFSTKFLLQSPSCRCGALHMISQSVTVVNYVTLHHDCYWLWITTHIFGKLPKHTCQLCLIYCIIHYMNQLQRLDLKNRQAYKIIA